MAMTGHQEALSPMSIFQARWSTHPRFAAFTAPRRPRHPLLRLALGVVGLALLLGLLFVSVFVGLAMLAGGMLWRLWKQRGKPLAPARGRALEGEFRTVGKTGLPLAH